MENQVNQPFQPSFFRFEDLRVYHKTLDYFSWLAEETKSANLHQMEIIVKPLMSSALSISVNIAEGSSRHKVQFVTFLKDARSSARECLVISNLAYNTGFLSEDQFMKSKDILMEITRMIGAMIVSFQRNSSRDYNEKKIDVNPSPDIDFEY